ncbi:MAG TPA: hopanoid biosynthesis-associated protein HpnK, partial [Stellaceae bacterium]|nr:hopanoid biosynthesis-associated protein HpnK [Stellaceae bacterium]
MKRVILSADDFGLDLSVNEAVEHAYRDGVLTSASLMVGEEAAEDAVARARRLPGLAVGLHVVLADGRPVSPAESVPDLVDSSGRFPREMVTQAFRFFLSSGIRRQLEREISAQFEAFAATGLLLDHVNAHKHFHLHPTIASLILRVGSRYGLRAVRVPAEPRGVIKAAEAHRRPGRVGAAALNLWTRQLRSAIAQHGCVANDHVFGLAWTGGMTEERLLSLIPRLPDGTSE